MPERPSTQVKISSDASGNSGGPVYVVLGGIEHGLSIEDATTLHTSLGAAISGLRLASTPEVAPPDAKYTIPANTIVAGTKIRARFVFIAGDAWARARRRGGDHDPR